MARLLSQVATVLRGSIGGITYSSNQFQPIIQRARVSPVNPCTNPQTLIRSCFAGAADAWKQQTDADRILWDDYAQTCLYSGPTGTYKINGRQMFIGNIGTAMYLIATGDLAGPIAYDPPVIPGFLDIGTVQVGIFAGAGQTGIAAQIDYVGSEDITAYGFRSVMFLPTRNRFKGPYVSDTLDAVDITPPASGLISWSGLVVGMIYFTRIRGITQAQPYRLSAEYFLRHVAVAVAP